MLCLDAEGPEGEFEGEEETEEMRQPMLTEGGDTNAASKSGSKSAKDDDGEDLHEDDVEELQRMMTRLQAARGMLQAYSWRLSNADASRHGYRTAHWRTEKAGCEGGRGGDARVSIMRVSAMAAIR
jgi:hypothetical protein